MTRELVLENIFIVKPISRIMPLVQKMKKTNKNLIKHYENSNHTSINPFINR